MRAGAPGVDLKDADRLSLYKINLCLADRYRVGDTHPKFRHAAALGVPLRAHRVTTGSTAARPGAVVDAEGLAREAYGIGEDVSS